MYVERRLGGRFFFVGGAGLRPTQAVGVAGGRSERGYASAIVSIGTQRGLKTFLTKKKSKQTAAGIYR